METDILASDKDLLEMSVLPAADSVDHNTLNIDGKCTFHGLGVNTYINPALRTNFLIPQKQATELNTRTKTKFLYWSNGWHTYTEVSIR